MKLVLKIFVVVILGIIIFITDYPLKEKTLYGKYVNTNYQNPICCVEAPHEPDTLILHSNGNFESVFSGEDNLKLVMESVQELNYIIKVLVNQHYTALIFQISFLRNQKLF